MQFMLVASAIAALVAVGAVHSLRNATQDAAGTGAQSTTDAGVAEAINYIRENGLLALTCAEPLNPADKGTCGGAGGVAAGGWAGRCCGGPGRTGSSGMNALASTGDSLLVAAAPPRPTLTADVGAQRPRS